MTSAPPPDDSELPCVTCRVSMAEHGTAYCDDCAEGERLEALVEAEGVEGWTTD